MSDEDDEDWFERAVGDDEASPPDEDRSPVSESPDETAGSADEGGEESTGGSEGFDAGDDSGRFETGEDSSPFETGDDSSPFETGDDSSPFETGDDSSPFEAGDEAGGMGSGGGGLDAGGEDGPFDEDFASAFEGAGDSNEFDEEDLDSDIPRIDLGVEGLDDMIQGGIPQRHLMVAIGSAGTGKTTFGLQFLHHGLKQGDNGVFITLEQSHEAILDTAAEWGWDFEAYEAEDELAIVDLDPVEMANSLDNIRGELPELIGDFGADRLVLDSVSLLEMMYDNPAQRRTEVYDFTRSLKKAGVTTFLTSEASESNAYASRHGIIEYLTDAVFVLQYVRAESRETRLAVEIMKIRNANHSRATKPYELTSKGISVYQQANIF